LHLMNTMEQYGTLDSGRTTISLIPIWLWFALNGLDVILSHISINLGAIEANPLISITASAYGEIAGYGLKLSLTTLVVFLLLKTEKAKFFKWLNTGMFLVILFNISTITYCLLAY